MRTPQVHVTHVFIADICRITPFKDDLILLAFLENDDDSESDSSSKAEHEHK